MGHWGYGFKTTETTANPLFEIILFLDLSISQSINYQFFAHKIKLADLFFLAINSFLDASLHLYKQVSQEVEDLKVSYYVERNYLIHILNGIALGMFTNVNMIYLI